MGSAAALGMSPASFLSGGRAWPQKKSASCSLPWGCGQALAGSQHTTCHLQCPPPGLTAATNFGMRSEQPFTAPCRDDDSDEFYDRTAGKAKLKRAKAQEPALDAATLYGRKVGSLHSARLVCKDMSTAWSCWGGLRRGHPSLLLSAPLPAAGSPQLLVSLVAAS